MPAPTNEQSLLQDFAEQVLADAGVGPAEFSWTSPKVLHVRLSPDEWARAGGAQARIQSRGGDAGFKVIMT